MTHTTSTPTPSIRARHTATCYAHAVGCAVENIAEWDAETHARNSTDPIEQGDGYLTDGTVSCVCADGVSQRLAGTLAAGYAALDDADVDDEPETFTCECGDHEYPVVPGTDESTWCECGARLNEQRQALADGEQAPTR
ncbi:hypothetical protein [Isoptericola sp. NPDC056605]|uniref:hypothetical protein n=1 Tax=Isoptericola sp. NPDC056605 TaxID=3345876 RepID=UPI0036A1857F